MKQTQFSGNLVKALLVTTMTLVVSGCTNDISLMGTGMTPGAPAPYGTGANEQTLSSAQGEEFNIAANKRVKVEGRRGTTVYFGSEDGFLAGLKQRAAAARPAETLVEGTRETLRFMGISKDYAIDKKYHRIETGWYKGKYKAIATINKTNLHASSLDLKIIDKQGRQASPQKVQEVETAIFQQTKRINSKN
ncbi:MAG: hypothetical protein ACK5MJ_04050 [Alphaproteobacteria bacterium]